MPLTLRISAATMIALSGLLVMIAMVGPSDKDQDMFAVAFLGAVLAGLRMATYFGHPGGDGILEATVGAMFATLLGAVLAGLLISFMLPAGGIFMILLAPAIVLIAIATPGPSTLIRFLALGITHLAMRPLRRRFPSQSHP